MKYNNKYFEIGNRQLCNNNLPILNNIGKTDYSYGMYLVHYPIILVLNYYNLFESNFVVAVIATIGVSFMIAYLLEIIQKKIK